MSDIPADLKFNSSHEWVRVEGDGRVTVGISDHAQDQLGDLVYVDLPEVDDHFDQGDSVAVLESVKAASDIFAPVSGTVVEVNEALEDEPEMVNNDAYGDGWLFVLKIDDPAELDEMLTGAEYLEQIEGESD